METVSVNKFRDNLKQRVEQTVSQHEPLRVSRRSGQDFVVISAEDWEREQETLYVLQNSSLMQQLAESAKTHAARKIIKELIRGEDPSVGIGKPEPLKHNLSGF